MAEYTGFTTAGSHHAILYGVANPVPVGTHECTEEEIMGSMTIIGGIGNEGTSGTTITLPHNLVRRIPAHTQLMIQTHWLNTTTEKLDGQAAFNVRFTPPSSDKTPTDFAAVMSTDFALPPAEKTHVTTECVFGQDVSFWQIAGHQHALGTHIKITHTPAGGAPSVLIDEDWQYRFALDPNFINYPDAPLVVHQGDTISVACDFANTESDVVHFPHEMCGLIGQYFPSNGQVLCFNGTFHGG